MTTAAQAHTPNEPSEADSLERREAREEQETGARLTQRVLRQRVSRQLAHEALVDVEFVQFARCARDAWLRRHGARAEQPSNRRGAVAPSACPSNRQVPLNDAANREGHAR